MKDKEIFTEKVLANIIKTRIDKRKTQMDVAVELGVDNATYCKIESGKIALTVDRLAKIASFFEMEVIDVIYGPKKYVRYDSLTTQEKNSPQTRVTLQIELNEAKRDKILEMIFESKEIELLKN